MWRAVAVADVKLRFQPFELATWQAIETANAEGSNPDQNIQAQLTAAVQAFVGAMAAADYPVNQDGTVPDQLRQDILSYAAWQWVLSFPGQRATEEFKTDPRKRAYDDACKNLEKIRTWTYGNIESPFGSQGQSGNWNSMRKLIMRTTDIPGPAVQWQGNSRLGGPAYANPNAVGDVTPRAVPQLFAPRNVQAQGGNGIVTISWKPVPGAASYQVFRGVAAGQELATPVAQAVTTNYWQDNTVANGTIYYYEVKAVSGALVSDLSEEVYATPNPGPQP